MKRALIVIGDRQNREIVKKVIENSGSETDLAHSAREALEYISSTNYTHIILDGNLEIGHGSDVIDRISQKDKTKVVVYSNELGFIAFATERRLRTFELTEPFALVWKKVAK